MSFFASVEMVPGDPILGLTERYLDDPRPHKVNLGVGVYGNDQGRLPVLKAVRQVEKTLVGEQTPCGYLPIDGLPAYNKATQTLLFEADSALLDAGRVVTAQTIGGSGALRVGADLLRQILGDKATVALSQPSWSNHDAIFRAAGFRLLNYRYYDTSTHGLDFNGMLEDLNQLSSGTVVLLHACCHNPTGVDPDPTQWAHIVTLLRERQLLPFMDIAYQGFSRDIRTDVMVVRLLANSGIDNFVVANSYSKSFSLYGERVGALSIVGTSNDEAQRLRSKIKQIIRMNYSSPATHGSALVARVLNSDELRALWTQELDQMRHRIQVMRTNLVRRLTVPGVPDFSFINRQVGMFSYSGLTPDQVNRLISEHAVYVLSNGRICVAALTPANLDNVARAIAEVCR